MNETEDDSIAMAADHMAKTLTLRGIQSLKAVGLNHDNRRRFMHLKRRNKLAAGHIPVWLVVNVLRAGATA